MPLTQIPNIQSQQHIYAVSELNQKIKRLLEESYPFLWISGEISNFRTPSSGHCYFTLKDDRSQINGVIFRTQANSLKFKPEDGLSVIGLGRISVYEPRGSYQIIFEYLEPKGIGALQIAFEKLKRRLSEEGLFDDRHKKAVPVLPRKISIVTSPTGAAIRDFIKVSMRRYPNLPLEVTAVRVQGEHAAKEIARAIRNLNERADTDIIVLARGGGSIEDLCAFNDEKVARAIFASRIPVVSAIGHETDFTIADFVSDLRAPTPSAAAEIVVPAKNEFRQQIINHEQKLHQLIVHYLNVNKKQLEGLSNRILHPKRRLQDMRMRVDDHEQRLSTTIRTLLARKRKASQYSRDLLMYLSPLKTVMAQKEYLESHRRFLLKNLERRIREIRISIENHQEMLEALNPLAILKRGYSITRTFTDKAIVRNARQVKNDQPLEILLGKGKLTVTVSEKSIETDGPE